jgi:hypothetical protein
MTGRKEEPAHFSIRVGLRDTSFELDRWSVVAPLSDDLRADIKREVQWGAGELAWVPPLVG